MKCQSCGNEVMGLNQKCPVCGTALYSNTKDITNKKEYNTTKSNITETKSETSRTVLLAIIGILSLLSCIGLGIYFITEENIFTGVIYILAGIISFAFIKGFTDIIDLLDNINKKLDN